jgi:S-layer homology domain
MYFPDVTPTYWAYGYIKYLYCRQIVSGYPDGLFRPCNDISRAEFSAIVTRGFGFPMMTPIGGQQSFTDVQPSYWGYRYIETLAAQGVISGYSQQQCATHGAAYPCFLPGGQITRAEMVKMVVVASGTPAYNGPLADYPDVPPSYWAYGYIKTATHKQWVGGFADGSFRPGAASSRAELGKVVYLAIVYPRGYHQ